MPFWNIAGIRSGAVVVVLERSNLRFGVGWHQTIFCIQSLCNIVIDAQRSIQKPFLSRPVLVFMDDSQAFERSLRQERATGCDRGYRARSGKAEDRGESNDAKAGELLQSPAE